MDEYIRQVRGFQRDVKLFLLYNLLVNVGFGVAQLIFNLYLYELALREDAIGAITAVQTLVMAATAATMGTLLNRFGTWRCISGGAMVYLVSSLGLAFVETASPLLMLAALNGVGLAFLFTATMPFLIEWSRPDQRQHAAAISFSLISFAATLGALLGGFLPALVGRWVGGGENVEAYRWTLVAGTLIGSLGLVPLFLMRQARQRKPPVDHAAAKAAEGVAQRRQVRRDMTVFVLIGGLMALGAGMVMPFYNVYLTTLGANAREVGYVYAAGSLAAAVIGLGAPVIAHRLGSIRAVFVMRLSVVPFYALLILTPGFGLAIVAHLVRQTSVSMGWPLDSTFISEVLPPRARAGVFGLRSAAWNVGFSAASLLAGTIIVRAGYDATFLSLIVFSTLSAVVFVAYFGRHPRVRAGEIPGALPRHARRPVAKAAKSGVRSQESEASGQKSGKSEPSRPLPATASLLTPDS